MEARSEKIINIVDGGDDVIKGSQEVTPPRSPGLRRVRSKSNVFPKSPYSPSVKNAIESEIKYATRSRNNSKNETPTTPKTDDDSLLDCPGVSRRSKLRSPNTTTEDGWTSMMTSDADDEDVTIEYHGHADDGEELPPILTILRKWTVAQVGAVKRGVQRKTLAFLGCLWGLCPSWKSVQSFVKTLLLVLTFLCCISVIWITWEREIQHVLDKVEQRLDNRIQKMDAALKNLDFALQDIQQRAREIMLSMDKSLEDKQEEYVEALEKFGELPLEQGACGKEEAEGFILTA